MPLLNFDCTLLAMSKNFKKLPAAFLKRPGMQHLCPCKNYQMKKPIFCACLVAALMITSAGSFAQTANTQIKSSKEIASVKPLPTKQVCMVTNKFMSKDQIPVQVNNKMYYGCCEGCVGTLKNNEGARTAKDELTKEKVDKAKAFIIVKPGTVSDVLYFSSKQNAATYLQKYAKK